MQVLQCKLLMHFLVWVHLVHSWCTGAFGAFCGVLVHFVDKNILKPFKVDQLV